MIPEKEKDCTNSSALKFKVVVHNFPIRSPMPIHIDGLIGLHSWCKVYLTCGEREKKKKGKWSYSSRNRSQPTSLLQKHWPIPRISFHIPRSKRKSQRCSFPLIECHCRRLHWLVLCSVETLICSGKKRDEVKHLLLKDFT